MKKTYQRECEICGGSFLAGTSVAKYCPRCRKDSNKARVIQAKKDSAKQYTYGGILFEKKLASGEIAMERPNCEVCGNPARTYHSNYCSDECMRESIARKAKCLNCGAKLYELGVIAKSGKGYCNEACQERYKWKLAEQEGRIGTCPQCGKQFIQTPSQIGYCSQQCEKTYNRIHNTKQPTQVGETCVVCKKRFKRDIDNRRKVCYSKECIQLWNQYIEKRKQQAEEKKQEAHMKKAIAGELPYEQMLELHLCKACKTPYTQCRYMKSKLVYHPEGAKIVTVRSTGGVMTNIVLVCPTHNT